MKLNPGKPRHLSSCEGKRVARFARAKQNVKYEQIADALHLAETHTKRLFTDDMYSQLTFGDLFLLAHNPQTADMVRDLLAPLLELVDRQSLRLRDLEGLASTSTGRDTALQILRSTVERIAPVENRADTGVAGE